MRNTARSWSRDAWERAVAAKEARLASTLTGDDHLARSAVRLHRSADRLNQSDRRVDRGRQRRRDLRG
jgi:hypothetical protein